MKIKSLFGFCSCKACKNRWNYEITVTMKNGKNKPYRLCDKHIKELLAHSKINSITLEQTIDLSE